MKCQIHQPVQSSPSSEVRCTCPRGIDSFSGQWAFLSNFSPCVIPYEGITYPSVEHAFQAAKTLDGQARRQIAGVTGAGEAKRLGRQVSLRLDWEQIKDDVMLELLTVKFAERVLGDRLVATGQIDLTEGNTWHDQYWGDCRCPRHQSAPGKNLLGKLLEQVRSTIGSTSSPSTDSAGKRGLFIVFEGGEATGKSTQSQLVAEEIGALWTREPGGSPLGATIRELCLGSRFDPSPEAELLLMGADRAEHVQTVMRPAIETGRHVVCDRYTSSTVAYQGAGRGIDAGLIAKVNDIAICGLKPDLVVVINVDEDVAKNRHELRGETDRMEQTGDEFHRRVRQSYLDQAAQDPSMVVVDGSGNVDEVLACVRQVLNERLGLYA